MKFAVVVVRGECYVVAIADDMAQPACRAVGPVINGQPGLRHSIVSLTYLPPVCTFTNGYKISVVTLIIGKSPD